MPAVHSNPYRRPKPSRQDVLFSEKFYRSNENGSYGLHPQKVYVSICNEYLWVDETLTIPLDSIAGTGLSKHGGYIQFVDTIANAEVRFYFTKVGFLRFKQKRIVAFLSRLHEHLDSREPLEPMDSEDASLIVAANRCEQCGAAGARPFVFRNLKFVGIVGIAYAYKLTPLRYVLCPAHARRQVLRDCLRTAASGYWGIPGGVTAPFYVLGNLWSLRNGAAWGLGTALSCILLCIVVPWAIITAAVLWLIHGPLR